MNRGHSGVAGWYELRARTCGCAHVDAVLAREDFDLYIVATREPLARFVSAFNWLHTECGRTAPRGAG